ncbi:hypothetical protein DEO72_LG8g2559 [Vigna unguiculata]|uniref:Uncharacterized protein n=1 Tax=Vigna unguiculata TaxID=3917 RepID=A0A4D6MTF6_VIGUN|nr:hypothetical protein DEO72_LG8g1199 [Vigna unguiculata]QCE04523.1 hypothetical protein DEO72_LG8g2559 [Vigna unguiculata]
MVAQRTNTLRLRWQCTTPQRCSNGGGWSKKKKKPRRCGAATKRCPGTSEVCGTVAQSCAGRRRRAEQCGGGWSKKKKPRRWSVGTVAQSRAGASEVRRMMGPVREGGVARRRNEGWPEKTISQKNGEDEIAEQQRNWGFLTLRRDTASVIRNRGIY